MRFDRCRLASAAGLADYRTPPLTIFVCEKPFIIYITGTSIGSQRRPRGLGRLLPRGDGGEQGMRGNGLFVLEVGGGGSNK